MSKCCKKTNISIWIRADDIYLVGEIHGQNDEDTRTFCGKFLYNAIASTDNAQHKNCPSSGIDNRPGRDLFRVLKRSPISQPHTLRRGYSDGRQQATRPDSDEDCIRIGEFPCYSHYAERLARLKQVPIFKVLARPGRDSKHTNNDLPGMKRALLPLGHTSGRRNIYSINITVSDTLMSKVFFGRYWNFSVLRLLKFSSKPLFQYCALHR